MEPSVTPHSRRELQEAPEAPALRVLALEPYYGGSHRAVLDGLIERLTPLGFAFDLLTLPARKWKWRMRGAAITMAEQARALAGAWREEHPGGEAGRPHPYLPWDLIYASTFVNLAEFVALAGAAASVPRIVYFHENQLLYPVRHTAEWDYQFPLTNITSALAADRCLFNTRYNLDGFLAGPGLGHGFPMLRATPHRHVPAIATGEEPQIVSRDRSQGVSSAVLTFGLRLDRHGTGPAHPARVGRDVLPDLFDPPRVRQFQDRLTKFFAPVDLDGLTGAATAGRSTGHLADYFSARRARKPREQGRLLARLRGVGRRRRSQQRRPSDRCDLSRRLGCQPRLGGRQPAESISR